jgi:hypothetical protein
LVDYLYLEPKLLSSQMVLVIINPHPLLLLVFKFAGLTATTLKLLCLSGISASGGLEFLKSGERISESGLS